MAVENIDPNELSLQGASGMQLVQILRRIIEEINNGGDTPTPTPSEPTGIYYCTFDVTTKDEITNAISNDLLPVCFHADKMYYLVAYQYGVYTFATISRDRGIISRIDCRVSGWSVQEPLEIQKVLTFDFTPTENSTNPVTSGGVYTAINNITIDPQDIADAVDDWLDEHSSSIGGLTFEAKQALMNCFAHVAWIDANGQTYYDALYNALFNTTTLESIYALFTQGSAVIYDTDSLDSLRQYLVVTAYYSDETSAVVTDYTLSGTLSVGTSTITASYGGKSSTFNVTVSQGATLESISAVFNQGSAVIYDTDTLDSLKQYLTVTANYSDSSTAIVPSADYTLSGTLTVGTSTITVSYGGKTTTFTVTVTEESPYTFYDYLQGDGNAYINTGLLASTYFTLAYDHEIKAARYNSANTKAIYGPRQQWGTANARQLWWNGSSGYGVNFCASSTTPVADASSNQVPITVKTTRDKKILRDGVEVTYTAGNIGNITHTGPITLFAECSGGQGTGYKAISGTNAYAGAYSACRIYYFKVWDANGDLVADIKPALRKSDNAVGMYDSVRDLFLENANNTGAFSLGNE